MCAIQEDCCHLGHRETHDLDLFTLADALSDASALTREIARSLGASVESIRTAPDFQRLLVRRGNEAVVVDLVRERVPQIVSEKPVVGGIRLDPPLSANKLLSRCGVRDLAFHY